MVVTALTPAPVQPSGSRPPVVSVIICTKDPRADLLARALEAIDGQTLAKDRFEVIVVDNGSTPPLDATNLRGSAAMPLTVLRELRPGLGHARCAGIAVSRGEVLVFVDDDNFLDPDYLEQSIGIAHVSPRVGLFGGISRAELEVPWPRWKQPVLPHLGVRNYGEQPITAFADEWGEWEPIGAGMVARREVAEKFVQMFQTLPDAHQLGRSGKALLSGEDTLFARAAHRCGFSCSYQPALRLTHYLKQSRMRIGYLTRLMAGHGRSYVLLHRALGKPIPALKVRTAVARLLHRVMRDGRVGFITWFWDLGYAFERRKDAAAGTDAKLPLDTVEEARHA